MRLNVGRRTGNKLLTLADGRDAGRSVRNAVLFLFQPPAQVHRAYRVDERRCPARLHAACRSDHGIAVQDTHPRIHSRHRALSRNGGQTVRPMANVEIQTGRIEAH